MKGKIIYIALIIAMLAGLVSLWIIKLITEEAIEVQPEKAKQEIADLSRDSFSSNIAPSTASRKKPAVTRIKKQSEVKTDSLKEIIAKKYSRSESSSSAVASSRKNEEFNEGYDFGVTDLGKRPTKEEIKEMNARGVILY